MSCGLEAVSLIKPADVQESVCILSQAFLRDPLMEYIFPDESQRLKRLAAFFGANLDFGMAVGEVYGTSPLLGCAIWIFPGDRNRARVTRAMVPMERIRLNFSDQEFKRYANFELYMKEVHVELHFPSYCLLLFLGVDEEHRCKGIGGRLMQPILKYADEKKLPCVLDTMNEENLAFYREQGFSVSSEYYVCGDGPRTWTMVRYPDR